MTQIKDRDSGPPGRFPESPEAAGPSHCKYAPEEVRTGMRFPIDCLRRRLRRLPAMGRMGFRRRSRVAALAASSRSRTSDKGRWGRGRGGHGAPWTPPGGQRRLQSLPADPVGGFPDHDHRLSDGVIVDAPASHGMRCAFIVVKSPKQPDAMLAMVAGHRDELVEDPALVLPGGHTVTVPDRRQRFLFCHLADAPSHAIASPILGNILIEATTFAG